MTAGPTPSCPACLAPVVGRSLEGSYRASVLVSRAWSDKRCARCGSVAAFQVVSVKFHRAVEEVR